MQVADPGLEYQGIVGPLEKETDRQNMQLQQRKRSQKHTSKSSEYTYNPVGCMEKEMVCFIINNDKDQNIIQRLFEKAKSSEFGNRHG